MRKVIAIDFDGCICKGDWPHIGEPNMEVINAAIREQQSGTALILWTCRVGERLEEAVQFCKSLGLEFVAVNDNDPERVAIYHATPRKVNADEYWDDLAVVMPDIRHEQMTARIEELERQNAALLAAWRETCEACGFNDACEHSDGCENVVCGAHPWRALWKKTWTHAAAGTARTALIDLGVEKIKLDRIVAALGAEELLGQLCEECGELIQAAQKMRRAMKGTTPVSTDDAFVRITEKCADVALRIDAIASAGIVNGSGVQFIGRYKNGRWYKRTKEAAE